MPEGNNFMIVGFVILILAVIGLSVALAVHLTSGDDLKDACGAGTHLNPLTNKCASGDGKSFGGDLANALGLDGAGAENKDD